MNSIPFPDVTNDFLGQHVQYIVQSYRMLLGRDLLDQDEQGVSLSAQLFHAPFVLLSHNTDQDPLFNYANQMGLSLFEMEWQELIITPSRYSAEAVNRKEREKLLNQVTENGFIDNYQGIRISKSGKRFLIDQAVVWNIYDTVGEYQGQAASFKDWKCLD